MGYVEDCIDKRRDKMEKEILEIISKNLPEQVGSVLKKRLEQAEKDTELVKQLGATICEQEIKLRALTKELDRHRFLDMKQKELNKQEDELSKRERNMSVWEANLRGSEAEKRADELAGFVGMVFRSPIFRKNVNGYQYVPSGQYGTINQPHNQTEETTEE